MRDIFVFAFGDGIELDLAFQPYMIPPIFLPKNQ